MFDIYCRNDAITKHFGSRFTGSTFNVKTRLHSCLLEIEKHWTRTEFFQVLWLVLFLDNICGLHGVFLVSECVIKWFCQWIDYLLSRRLCNMELHMNILQFTLVTNLSQKFWWVMSRKTARLQPTWQDYIIAFQFSRKLEPTSVWFQLIILCPVSLHWHSNNVWHLGRYRPRLWDKSCCCQKRIKVSKHGPFIIDENTIWKNIRIICLWLYHDTFHWSKYLLSRCPQTSCHHFFLHFFWYIRKLK